jgi:hypothetical protein
MTMTAATHATAMTEIGPTRTIRGIETTTANQITGTKTVIMIMTMTTITITGS